MQQNAVRGTVLVQALRTQGREQFCALAPKAPTCARIGMNVR
jgi:hypothetical protein